MLLYQVYIRRLWLVHFVLSSYGESVFFSGYNNYELCLLQDMTIQLLVSKSSKYDYYCYIILCQT